MAAVTEQATAKADRSAPPGRVAWDVVAVRALPDFRLHVRFNDGTEGTVDLGRFVHASDAGMFAALADPTRFAAVGIEQGAVTWPGVLETWPWSLDLAPDAMHTEIRGRGEWAP